MPVNFKCSHCGFEKSVSRKLLGRKLKCPSCEQTTRMFDDSDIPREPAIESGEKQPALVEYLQEHKRVLLPVIIFLALFLAVSFNWVFYSFVKIGVIAILTAIGFALFRYAKTGEPLIIPAAMQFANEHQNHQNSATKLHSVQTPSSPSALSVSSVRLLSLLFLSACLIYVTYIAISMSGLLSGNVGGMWKSNNERMMDMVEDNNDRLMNKAEQNNDRIMDKILRNN